MKDQATIGHMKTDGRLDQNFLKGHDGDAINALLVAAGNNLRLILNALIFLLFLISNPIRKTVTTNTLSLLRPFEDGQFALHEVYYDEAGKPNGYTANPIAFTAHDDEGAHGIVLSLKMALNDAEKRPVLHIRELEPVD